MSTIGERLRLARKSRGWSQDTLASKTGLSRSTIGMYEQGRREPDFETLELFADTFNCSMSFLIENDRNLPKDDELWEMREAIRKNPDTRTLFKLARNATAADIKAAIAVLESLKGTRDE